MKVGRRSQDVGATEKLTAFMATKLPAAQLLEQHDSHFRYKILDSTLRLAELFELFEASKAELGISEYAVAQTTLEQIFNQFVRRLQDAGRLFLHSPHHLPGLCPLPLVRARLRSYTELLSVAGGSAGGGNWNNPRRGSATGRRWRWHCAPTGVANKPVFEQGTHACLTFFTPTVLKTVCPWHIHIRELDAVAWTHASSFGLGHFDLGQGTAVACRYCRRRKAMCMCPADPELAVDNGHVG